MSSDSHIISELIAKYGEYGTRRIISNANNYFYDLDRKKEENDRKEILENPAVLNYIQHFKDWINAEAKKIGHKIFKSKDRINFETINFDMGWYGLVQVNFRYGISLVPIDLSKKSFLTFDREDREFRYNIVQRFYEKHQPIRYLELSRDNQYGMCLDLVCDVYNLSNFEIEWG